MACCRSFDGVEEVVHEGEEVFFFLNKGAFGIESMMSPMKTRGVQVCFRRRRKTKSFGNPEKAKAENSGRLGDCGCSIKRY